MTASILHIVASGCSQTQDGIGGCPPSLYSDGGCSYIDKGDGTPASPQSWLGFVAQRLGVTSLINLAASSAGNFYVAQTLIETLTRYSYPREQTLVLFNVTEPGRMDFACAFDHPDSCPLVPYNDDLIPYSWLHRHSRIHDQIKKNMGIENVHQLSRTALISLFSFLENNGFRYQFMTMRNYLKDPYLGQVLSSNSHRIDLDPGGGIVEHSEITNTLLDCSHPNLQGHQLIAEQVLRRLK